jgi:SPP1 family predicted phage head-tail adaptor
MSAGELRHKLTIQQPDTTEGSAGEELPNYSTFASVWGKVEELSGSELLVGRQAGSDVTHSIKIRHHSGIKSNMRVLWDVEGRYFNLTQPPIDKDTRKRYVYLMCREVTTP